MNRTVVFAAALSVMAAAAAAQTRLDPKLQEAGSQAPAGTVPIDIARIRRLLEGPRQAGSESALRGLDAKVTVNFLPQPVYVDASGTVRFTETVNVVAVAIRAPTLAEQLVTLDKESRFPYSYAPSLQELSTRIPGFQYLHPVNAVMAAHKAIGGALYRRKVEKARREVEAELQALIAHNAAVAAAESKPPKNQD